MNSTTNPIFMLPTLYHVTPADNLDIIMKEGLVPQIGERSQASGENIPMIYFFDSESNLEQALLGWLGEELEGKSVVVLEVRLPKSFQTMLRWEAFEVQCQKRIPPLYIRIRPS